VHSKVPKVTQKWSKSDKYATRRNERCHSPVLWYCSSLKGALATTKEWNDLGLSLCAVPQSPVTAVVTHFGVAEHCSENERSSGIEEKDRKDIKRL